MISPRANWCTYDTKNCRCLLAPVRAVNSSCRLCNSPEPESTNALPVAVDLGRKCQLVLRVRMKIANPQHKRFTERAFGFQVPREAVGCEVAIAVLLMEEGVPRLSRLADDVEVGLRSTDDVSRAIIAGYSLFRIFVESIRIKRNGSHKTVRAHREPRTSWCRSESTPIPNRGATRVV